MISKQSYASDKKVGSVIVKDKNIISFSYNGTLPGNNNCTVDESGKTRNEVLHAETQAIAKIARSTQSTEGATMYCTLSPCIECAKLISQVGIRRLVYSDLYKCHAGVLYLKKSGVLVNEPDNHCNLADNDWLAQSGLNEH